MTKMIVPLTLSFLTLFASCRSHTESDLPGVRMRAVRIIDGDTFEGLSDGVTYKIRLDAIDAPEKSQPYYHRSKETLGQLCAEGPLRVELLSKDRYGRWIGRVYDRNGSHVNALMISEGMAWHYLKYSKDQTLSRLESDARSQRKGLWADPTPVAPWDHRQRKRTLQVQ